MDLNFLYYIKYSMILTGTLSSNLVKYKDLYVVYASVTQAFFVFIIISLCIEVPAIWDDRSKLIETVNTILTCSVAIIKTLISKTAGFGYLISEIVAMEDKLIATKDEIILKIYKSYVQRGKYVQIYYMVFCTMGVPLLYGPFLVKYIILWDENANNSTIERRQALLTRLPFNEDNHYITAFIVKLCFGFYASLYYFHSQVIFIVLLLYVNFRLQVLNSYLINVKQYAETNCDDVMADKNNEAVEAVIKFCILEHITIMRYIQALNDNISYFMVMEFIWYSAQIALILFELMSGVTTRLFIFGIMHLLLIAVPLMIFYSHGNEIRMNSEAISYTLYEMEWFNFNYRTKRIIHIMMTCAQKPLGLAIGPFGEVSLEMALKIMKGAYSYITFLRSTYGVSK